MRMSFASSPYARRGALWTAHRQHFAKDGPILVWQADTRTMNPTVPQRVIDEAMERDPASASSEYGAQFRSDIADFVSREAVEACVGDYFERAPSLTTNHTSRSAIRAVAALTACRWPSPTAKEGGRNHRCHPRTETTLQT